MKQVLYYCEMYQFDFITRRTFRRKEWSFYEKQEIALADSPLCFRSILAIHDTSIQQYYPETWSLAVHSVVDVVNSRSVLCMPLRLVQKWSV